MIKIVNSIYKFYVNFLNVDGTICIHESIILTEILNSILYVIKKKSILNIIRII